MVTTPASAVAASLWALEKAALLATIKQHEENRKTMSAAALAKVKELKSMLRDVEIRLGDANRQRDELLVRLERLVHLLADARPPVDDDVAHDEHCIETLLEALIVDHQHLQGRLLSGASASSSSSSSSSSAGGGSSDSGVGRSSKRTSRGGGKENNVNGANGIGVEGDNTEGHASKKGRAAATWAAFLTDDPDPQKKWGCACKRADCKQEIHYSDGAKSAYNKAHHCATKKK